LTEIKRAIILAGGKGTRLAPYTTVLPKPLMPIDDLPILEVVLRQLKFYGFQRVTLAVGHLAELLMAFCGDGRKWGLELDYSREDQPLGTAGPLALIDGLEESFLLMNGDVLTDLDYRQLITFHQNHGAAATIAMHQRSEKINLGVIETNENCEVTGYIEKPTYHYQVSMGIYIFEPRVLKYIEPGSYLDFPDLILRLLKEGERVMGYPFDGYWLDIGRHDDYATAVEEFQTHRSRLLRDEGQP